MTVLALKLLLAPGFIVATTLISRRFGVGVAGIVAGLPAIAGPILLVLALDHGHGFARSAANGVLLGIVALVVFVLAFRVGGPPGAVAVGARSRLGLVRRRCRCASPGPRRAGDGLRPGVCRLCLRARALTAARLGRC